MKTKPAEVTKKASVAPVAYKPAPKVILMSGALRPKLDEEALKKLYDGAFVRNTYDWFYDSLTERERYEFIDLFVYKELGRSQYLPDFIIRGDNYMFFKVFFENLGLFYDKLSPTLLEKMYQYCNNNYKTTF